MKLRGKHAQSFTPEMLAAMRDRFVCGHGSLPLIGMPDEAADQIAALQEAGFDGATLAFVDYAGELEYLTEEVILWLEARSICLPR